jgi:hypothetical protein
VSERREGTGGRRRRPTRAKTDGDHTREETPQEQRDESSEARESSDTSESPIVPVETLGSHGVRSTVPSGLNQEEARRVNYELAKAEGYADSAARATSAGPDPYSLEPTKERGLVGPEAEEQARQASLAAAEAESGASDAEVAIPGETVIDTGAKIELHPDRMAANAKTELPKADEPHEEAIKEAPEGALTADRNAGLIFGGKVGENPPR